MEWTGLSPSSLRRQPELSIREYSFDVVKDYGRSMNEQLLMEEATDAEQIKRVFVPGVRGLY